MSCPEGAALLQIWCINWALPRWCLKTTPRRRLGIRRSMTRLALAASLLPTPAFTLRCSLPPSLSLCLSVSSFFFYCFSNSSRPWWTWWRIFPGAGCGSRRTRPRTPRAASARADPAARPHSARAARRPRRAACRHGRAWLGVRGHRGAAPAGGGGHAAGGRGAQRAPVCAAHADLARGHRVPAARHSTGEKMNE